MRRLLFISFWIAYPIIVSAQEGVLDKNKWNQLRDDVEFVKGKSKNTGQENTNKSSGDSRRMEENDQSDSSGTVINAGPFIQILIILFFIIFIAALLYIILSNVSLKKGEQKLETKSSDIITSIEEDFSKNNLERWLRHAREINDYYLILRIQFLMILKSLEQKRLILWKKDKTNWHYIQELSDHHFQHPFKDLVFEFDHVWYGEKKYSEDTLKEKIGRFESFKDMVDK